MPISVCKSFKNLIMRAHDRFVNVSRKILSKGLLKGLTLLPFVFSKLLVELHSRNLSLFLYHRHDFDLGVRVPEVFVRGRVNTAGYF
jgi:hypothetical protein